MFVDNQRGSRQRAGRQCPASKSGFPAASRRHCFSLDNLIERAHSFEIPHRRLGRRCTNFNININKANPRERRLQ